MNVLFTSDPHLGHKNIHKFRDYVDTCKENTELFFDQYATHVTKRTRVYFLGDVLFDRALIPDFIALKGEKYLVKGNHDNDYLRTEDHRLMFKEILGLVKYKKFWLSHAPIHPEELRGSMNIHGHVHDATLMDFNYINVSQDALYKETGSIFISLEDLVGIRDKGRVRLVKSSSCIHGDIAGEAKY